MRRCGLLGMRVVSVAAGLAMPAGIAVLCAMATVAPAIAEEGFPAVDYSKPTFTKRHTPLCESREELATQIALLRSGQAALAGPLGGCAAAPADGMPVVVVDRAAAPQAWVNVRIVGKDEQQQAFWTIGWMLRNDAGPAPPAPSAARGQTAQAGQPVQTAKPVEAPPDQPQSPGLVRVCLTKTADNPTFPNQVVLPRLSVFEDGGQRVGDLRDPWTKDAYRNETVNLDAAIVTTGGLELSRDKPCGEVGARMWTPSAASLPAWHVSPDHVWDFAHVLGYPIDRLPQPNNLERLRGMIVIRAIVVTDIGDTLAMSDDDAARQDPANPAARISTDTAKANSVPPDGPDGKGNFMVCVSPDIAVAGYKSVTVPQNLLFESYGRMAGGDLRAPELDASYPGASGIMPFAVVTQHALTLTDDNPCAVTSVRSVLSGDWRWPFPMIMERDRLIFYALKLKDYNGDPANLPGHLGDALGGRLLNGTPIADIGSPLNLRNTMR